MITELLTALSAIPRIAASLEKLAGTVERINDRAAKARASKRRGRKDDEVENRIADLVDVQPVGLSSRKTGEQPPPHGSA